MYGLPLFETHDSSVLVDYPEGGSYSACAVLKWSCLFLYEGDTEDNEALLDSYPLTSPFNRSVGIKFLSKKELKIRHPNSESPIVITFDSSRDAKKWFNTFEQNVTVDELETRFQKVRLLGQDGCKKVYQVRDAESSYDEDIALKVIPAEELEGFNEVGIMSSISHRNVLRAYEIVHTKENVSIFMRFMNQGSLYDVTSKYGPVPEVVARDIMRKVLCGIQYLHRNRIAHRDIKPGNIMLDYDADRHDTKLIVKIGDFGLAGELAHRDVFAKWETGGTHGYKAYERVRNRKYGLPADIFSCGVVLYEMLTGKYLFHRDDPQDTTDAIIRGYRPSRKDGLSKEVTCLIGSMVEKDQHLRMDAAEALEHPWFSEADEECTSDDLRSFFYPTCSSSSTSSESESSSSSS